MSKIIRCNLPDGVKRFKPFTVRDYRDLLLMRNDMEKNPIYIQEEILNELLDMYFPGEPINYQIYIFCVVFLSSIGKTKLPLIAECPKCKTPTTFMVNFAHKGLSHPTIKTSGLTIKIRFPKIPIKDIPEYIVNNIMTVADSEKEYNWDSMSKEEKNVVIDCIGKNELEEIVNKLNVLNYDISYYHCGEKHGFIASDILTIFKMFIHPDEVFSFYQINHRLVQFHYDLNSIMDMLPIERTVALSLIEKDVVEK